MKHVTILIPHESVLPSIVDARTMFTGANEFLAAAGKSAVFDVQLAGLTREVKFSNGLFTINVDVLVKDLTRTDLVIIPAIGGDMKRTLEMNKDLVPWIIMQYQNGAEIASLCIGAFLLASTGLLDGKECSSHWKKLIRSTMTRSILTPVNCCVPSPILPIPKKSWLLFPVRRHDWMLCRRDVVLRRAALLSLDVAISKLRLCIR